MSQNRMHRSVSSAGRFAAEDDYRLNFSLGRDIRRRERGRWQPIRDVRDVLQREEQLIERAAAIRLERATRGRLTFSGDNVVRTFESDVRRTPLFSAELEPSTHRRRDFAADNARRRAAFVHPSDRKPERRCEPSLRSQACHPRRPRHAAA